MVGTHIALFGVLTYLIIRLQLYALPPAEQNGELQRLYGDPAVGALSAIIGFSIVGGYVAAWIAGHHQRLNGALSSFLCVALSVYSLKSLSIGWVVEGLLHTMQPFQLGIERLDAVVDMAARSCSVGPNSKITSISERIMQGNARHHQTVIALSLVFH